MIYYDTRPFFLLFANIFEIYNYLNIDDNLKFYLVDSVI